MPRDFEYGLQEIGRAELHQQADALEIAKRMATMAEIGNHMVISSRKADTAMRKRSVTRISVGQDRHQLIQLGVLPGA